MFTKELLKNKFYAMILVTAGIFSLSICGDGTFFIFSLLLALPLFFAKENWIE